MTGFTNNNLADDGISGKDPTKTDLGIVFNHLDYVIVTGDWIQTSQYKTTVHIWINVVTGVPKEFADLRTGVGYFTTFLHKVKLLSCFIYLYSLDVRQVCKSFPIALWR